MNYVLKNIFNDNYIEKNDIIGFFKDKITFIRIKNSFCIDGGLYGKNFMLKYDLIKKKIQNEKNIDMYD